MFTQDTRDLPRSSGIYCIKNDINNKIYIGSSINIKNRILHHLISLKRNKHRNRILQRSFNKYKIENFSFCAIMIIQDKNKLLANEQLFLDLFKPYDKKIGFNICKIAGNTMGKKHSEKSKKQISLNKIGKYTIKCCETNDIFYSLMEASQKLEVSPGSLRHHLLGGRSHVNGYTFKFLDDSKNIKYVKRKKEKLTKDAILSFRQKIKNTFRKKKFICHQNNMIFEFTRDAANFLNIKYNGISSCLQGSKKSTFGYTFSFLSDLEIKKLNLIESLL